MASKLLGTKIFCGLVNSGMVGGAIGGTVGGIQAIQMYYEGQKYIPISEINIAWLPVVGMMMGFTIGIGAPITIPLISYQIYKSSKPIETN